jgi:hypothetical protein
MIKTTRPKAIYLRTDTLIMEWKQSGPLKRPLPNIPQITTYLPAKNSRKIMRKERPYEDGRENDGRRACFTRGLHGEDLLYFTSPLRDEIMNGTRREYCTNKDGATARTLWATKRYYRWKEHSKGKIEIVKYMYIGGRLLCILLLYLIQLECVSLQCQYYDNRIQISPCVHVSA